MRSDLVDRERDEGAGPRAVRHLNLGEDEKRAQERVRDARAHEAEEAIDLEHRGGRNGQATVEANRRAEPHEDADPDRDSDLAWRGPLPQDCDPNRAQASARLLHGAHEPRLKPDRAAP